MPFDRLKRREFITLIGGAAAAWPRAAGAQQTATPVIGFLHSGAADGYVPLVAAYRRGLGEAGFKEGENVAIEFRWANGQYDRLPSMAADLVAHQVAVIAAGGPPAARAAKAATATIPIVFTSGDDPVQAGFVASLSHPGGNVTGVYLFLTQLIAKKLSLLHDLLPRVTVIGAILNPGSAGSGDEAKDLETAARALGPRVDIVNAKSVQEIEVGFVTLRQQGVGAVVVGADPYYLSQRTQIVALAERHALPAMYELRPFVDAGGLISYGTDLSDGYRQAGVYAGQILRGKKSADLPVLQSTKFQLVINLKTAKSLSIKISDNMLSLADEVIE
jgi:putative ABC transport system substrate-binding protein